MNAGKKTFHQEYRSIFKKTFYSADKCSPEYGYKFFRRYGGGGFRKIFLLKKSSYSYIIAAVKQ
jgi:hypothetical protein